MSSEEVKGTDLPIGREYPERPIASVAACVFKGDRVLLIKRATPPSQGLWSVPGGMIELGETFQDAAKRELDEECGIEIEIDRIFHVENFTVPDNTGRIRFHYIVTYLVARYISGELRPGSDAMDVRWVTSQGLTELDMNPVVRDIMLRSFKIERPLD